jgi:putative transposase
LGNLLDVQVHAANLSDTRQGWRVCARAVTKYPTIAAFSADDGYRGTTRDCVEHLLGVRLDIASKPKDGFQVIPKRWIVERTFAWLGAFRR